MWLNFFINNREYNVEMLEGSIFNVKTRHRVSFHQMGNFVTVSKFNVTPALNILCARF